MSRSLRPWFFGTLLASVLCLGPLPGASGLGGESLALASEEDDSVAKAEVGDTPSDIAVVDTDVAPEEARVLLDGKDVGEADEFDGNPGYLVLTPGVHTLQFRHKGYQTLEIELDARPGRRYEVDRTLHKGKPNEVRRESWVPPR